MYANTVAYERGKRAGYYIDQAGGYASDAVKGRAYIIYMNGKVSKPMHERYVEPSKKFAHLVVPEGGKNMVALSLRGRSCAPLPARPSIWRA